LAYFACLAVTFSSFILHPLAFNLLDQAPHEI
jgi:hypothetical protein